MTIDRQHLPTHLRSTLGICLLTWGLLWASADHTLDLTCLILKQVQSTYFFTLKIRFFSKAHDGFSIKFISKIKNQTMIFLRHLKDTGPARWRMKYFFYLTNASRRRLKHVFCQNVKFTSFIIFSRHLKDVIKYNLFLLWSFQSF